MSGCPIRKIVMVLLCGFAVSGTGFGGLVLDCDSSDLINGLGTSISTEPLPGNQERRDPSSPGFILRAHCKPCHLP